MSDTHSYKRKIHLIGQKYGRLTVIGEAEPYFWHGRGWGRSICRCDCGTIKIVRDCSLRSGETISCGCLPRELNRKRLMRHGLRKDPLYKVWKGMRERCNNPNFTNHHLYYDRGIRVCPEWNDFPTFRNWCLEHGWKPRLTIDRIDNAKGYSPDNCRIVTFRVNNENRDIARDRKTGQYISVRNPKGA